MSFIKEESGKYSIKRVVALLLILVSIVFAALTLKGNEQYYVTFFGSSGMAGIGLTVINNIFKKNK
jgi:succinate dehydrogenase hydrophobic anchor subunit